MEENKDIEEVVEPASEEKEETKKEKKSKQKIQIEELEHEVADLKDKLLRNAAELENYKKRMNEERIKDRKYASMNLVGDLIGALQNLDRCVNMETDDEKLKNFLIGFKMINTQIFDILRRDGLEDIKTENQMFDPNVHHAIEQIEDSTKESGIIVEVVQKGYKYKDRVVVPAMVKVNK